MRALIILDCQRGMYDRINNDDFKRNIEKLIEWYSSNNQLIIAMKHIDMQEESIIFYSDETKSDLISVVREKADIIIEKESPNIFQKTDLYKILKEANVTDVAICGLNAEYCCLFSAILMQDRGFKVTYIEDATETVNTPEDYEMPTIDIVDFVGCVLDWSGIIEVLYLDEFMETV